MARFARILCVVLFALTACSPEEDTAPPPLNDDTPSSFEDVTSNIDLLGAEPIFMRSFADGVQMATGPAGAVMLAWSQGAATSAVLLDGGAWAPLDDLFDVAVNSYAIDATGAPVAIMRERNDSGFTQALNAVRWDGTGWQPLGNPMTDLFGPVDIEETPPALVLAGPTLVAVFNGRDLTNGEGGLFAVALQGEQWQPLGNGPLHDETVFDDFELVVSPDGDLAVVVIPTVDNPNTVLAYRWDGAVWQAQPTYRTVSDEGGFSFIIDAVVNADEIVVLFVSGVGSPQMIRLRAGSWGRVGLMDDLIDLVTETDGDPLAMTAVVPFEANVISNRDGSLVTMRGDNVLDLPVDGSPIQASTGGDGAVYVLSIPGGNISTENRSALIFRFALPPGR